MVKDPKVRDRPLVVRKFPRLHDPYGTGRISAMRKFGIPDMLLTRRGCRSDLNDPKTTSLSANRPVSVERAEGALEVVRRSVSPYGG